MILSDCSLSLIARNIEHDPVGLLRYLRCDLVCNSPHHVRYIALARHINLARASTAETSSINAKSTCIIGLGLLNQRVDAEHNTMIRLSRTFAAQMEALKRYRSTGEQSIRVQHQHVNVNAQQAVVGINQEGEGGQENGSQPHEPNRPHEPSTPLLSHVEAVGFALPITGSQRMESMPLPRSPVRGTKR